MGLGKLLQLKVTLCHQRNDARRAAATLRTFPYPDNYKRVTTETNMCQVADNRDARVIYIDEHSSYPPFSQDFAGMA